MDFLWLGMWELHGVALHWWLRGAGSKLLEGVCAPSGGRKKSSAALSLRCSWSWFKGSEALVLLSTNQTAVRDAGSSLDPFCVANRHYLHESIAIAEKVKYETASPPWLARKYQVLASLDTCSNWLLSSTSPKAFGFPASNFLLGKRHKKRENGGEKDVATTKCFCSKMLCRPCFGRRKELEHSRQGVFLR